jgi:hypothetical protein
VVWGSLYGMRTIDGEQTKPRTTASTDLCIAI